MASARGYASFTRSHSHLDSPDTTSALPADGDDPRGSVSVGYLSTDAQPPRRPHREHPGNGHDGPRFPGPIGRLQRQQLYLANTFRLSGTFDTAE